MDGPHVEIGLREIYDKQCVVEDKVNSLLPLTDIVKATEDRVRVLEMEVASMKAGLRSVDRFKLMLYPTWAALGGSVILAIVTMVYK